MKYIIKYTATATPDNPNFAGAVHDYFYGVNEHLVSDIDTGKMYYYLAKEYGYKYRKTAVRAMNKFIDRHKHSPYKCFWEYTGEVIEIN